MTLLPLLLTTSLLVSAPAGQAHEDSARALIQRGLALAAGGDTAAAITELRAAVDADDGLAEAHFHLGRLLARQASAVDTEDWQQRKEALEALREALKLDRDNPEYLNEYGWLLIKRNSWNDAERVLERALRLAEERRPDDADLQAEIHMNLAYIEELRWDQERDRLMNLPTRERMNLEPVSTPFPQRWVRQQLENNPKIEGFGADTRSNMLEHYHAAVQLDEENVEATRRLLLGLLDADRIDEYESFAENLVGARPERWESHLYRGLGLHVAGREDEAEAAFDRALSLMPDREREAFESLELTLRRQTAQDYLAYDPQTRKLYEQQFWRVTDPLYLTRANERRLEHIARIAYADLRFAEPVTGKRGWETDRGIIFIRYGPPDVVGRTGIGRNSRINVAWLYGDGLAFMFEQQAGYRRVRLGDRGDWEFVAAEAREYQPASYHNIPSIPLLLPVPIQVARFRGDSPDEVAVEVHAELPLQELARDLDVGSGEVETGLFVLRMTGQRLSEQVDTMVLAYEEAANTNALRSWRVLVPPVGNLVAAVEARDAATLRAATAREIISTEPFTADTLLVSDILLARALRPLAREPQRRQELDITPNPTLDYATRERIHIYYDIYGLETDSEGFAGFNVALNITVKALSREGEIWAGDRNPLGILAKLADFWGFSAVGDDQVELRFSRELPLGDRDRVIEFQSLDLREAPAGEYEIRLRVYDRLGERLAEQRRTFTVHEDE